MTEGPTEVVEHLTLDEIKALRERVRGLLAVPDLPQDHTGTQFPWLLV